MNINLYSIENGLPKSIVAKTFLFEGQPILGQDKLSIINYPLRIIPSIEQFALPPF